jgi:hypothetical protein
MTKKKAVGKTSPKKSAKKQKKNLKRGKKELDPVELRKDIEHMVKSEAGEIAGAVIGEGKKGQLATVKYLFEMAKIFPPSTDGSQASAEEDCLAKTLLHRLNLPEEPISRDEDGETEGARKMESGVGNGEAMPHGDGESKDPVLT